MTLIPKQEDMERFVLRARVGVRGLRKAVRDPVTWRETRSALYGTWFRWDYSLDGYAKSGTIATFAAAFSERFPTVTDPTLFIAGVLMRHSLWLEPELALPSGERLLQLAA